MSVRLIHYSKEPLAKVHDVDAQGSIRGIGKPHGLWVSVEGEYDWPAWCNAEKFGLERLAIQTEVVLAEDADILLISNVGELDEFHRLYGGGTSYDVNWRAVEKLFDGIIIAPYLWERRLSEIRWYYAWDCASGCIWKARAVAELKPIPGIMAPASAMA